MLISKMDLSEFPSSYTFAKLVEREIMRWEAYTPARSIEGDAPFFEEWWKYVYWVPKIKKDLYLLVMKSPNWEIAVEDWAHSLGMNYGWFRTNYSDLFKRLAWMRKNYGQNHVGEISK